MTSGPRDLTAETMAWVEERGVVLQSARGPLPNVAAFIAGGPIRGSWWGHVAGTQIYAILNALDDSPDVVSTRLVNDKVTLIHARLWPAIARVAYELGVDRLAAIHHEHTVSGAHRRFEVDFPLWVPKHVLVRAKQLSRDQAFDLLPDCLQTGR